MSYLFFEEVLTELGHKLTYDAVVNYAGNSFCDKSWEMISKSNPMNTSDGTEGAMKNFVDFLGGAQAKIGKPKIAKGKVSRK